MTGQARLYAPGLRIVVLITDWILNLAFYKLNATRSVYYFLNFIVIFYSRERKGERERQTSMWEKHPSVGSCTCTKSTHNLGMYPDWESNPRPFRLWDDAPTNWTTPGRATMRLVQMPPMRFRKESSLLSGLRMLWNLQSLYREDISDDYWGMQSICKENSIEFLTAPVKCSSYNLYQWMCQ